MISNSKTFLVSKMFMPKAVSETSFKQVKEFVPSMAKPLSHNSPVIGPTQMQRVRPNGSSSPVSQAFNQPSFVLFPIDKPQGKPNKILRSLFSIFLQPILWLFCAFINSVTWLRGGIWLSYFSHSLYSCYFLGSTREAWVDSAASRAELTGLRQLGPLRQRTCRGGQWKKTSANLRTCFPLFL